jgi:hypothetical protein
VLSATSGRGGARTWFLAGVAAVAAVAVKQSMVDVVAAAAAAVGWMLWNRHWRAAGSAAGAFVAGAVVTLGAVLAWAAVHGTTVAGLWDAVVKFRAAAARVIATSAIGSNEFRAQGLVLAFLVSGALGILAAAVLPPAPWRRRRRRSAEEAADEGASGAEPERADEIVHPDHPHADLVLMAAAVVAWETFAVAAGGSYWLHYLVEGVPVVALAAGALSSVRRPEGRTSNQVLVAGVVVSALVSLVAVALHPQPAPGAVVARSLSSAAQPGDTMLSTFGDADIVEETGMSSPYPYLWSLPSRTLDPDFTLLRGILTGPEAPTWVVVRDRHTATLLHARGVLALIDARYRPVGTVCTRSIYLLRSVTRPPLGPHGDCGGLVLP